MSIPSTYRAANSPISREQVGPEDQGEALPDYYDILGVDHTASRAQIEQAAWELVHDPIKFEPNKSKVSFRFRC